MLMGLQYIAPTKVVYPHLYIVLLSPGNNAKEPLEFLIACA